MQVMNEIEQVMRNWIAQAMSPLGAFPDDADRAKWVAGNFINWWRAAAEENLTKAQACANSVALLHEELGISRRDELEDELLDMTEQLTESLSELRRFLGLERPH